MGIRAFLNTRYRAILGRKDDGDHWLGGAVDLQGANCPNCKIPLVLHWDINCRDPRFRRNKFGPLDRLPLLFCWSCVDDIGYRITDRGRIKILTGKIPGFANENPGFAKPHPGLLAVTRFAGLDLALEGRRHVAQGEALRALGSFCSFYR